MDSFPQIADEAIAATLYNVLLRFHGSLTPYEERVIIQAIDEFDPELHAAITDGAPDDIEEYEEYEDEADEEESAPSDEYDI